MSILFRFSDPQLGQPLVRNILAKGICQGLGFKRHLDIGHFGIVLSHADKIQREKSVFTDKPIKVRIH